MQGPPAVLYLISSEPSKEQYMGMISAYLLFGNIGMTIVRAMNGFLTPAVWEASLWGVFGVVIGASLGAWVQVLCLCLYRDKRNHHPFAQPRYLCSVLILLEILGKSSLDSRTGECAQGPAPDLPYPFSGQVHVFPDFLKSHRRTSDSEA